MKYTDIWEHKLSTHLGSFFYDSGFSFCEWLSSNWYTVQMGLESFYSVSWFPEKWTRDFDANFRTSVFHYRLRLSNLSLTGYHVRGKKSLHHNAEEFQAKFSSLTAKLNTSYHSWSGRNNSEGLLLTFVFSFSPYLSWRDVQHVIVNSARRAPGDPGTSGMPLKRGGWVRNKAGLYVSKFYGFGLMDAERMVSLAKDWKPVPRPQLRCEIQSTDKNK